MIFNAQARHFNLLLPQGSSSNALLYYQATKNARRRLNTRTKNWNGSVELFLGDLFQNFKISRPLRDVKFTINLAHGDKLIGRFYYILHGFSNKNLCPPPPLESVLPKSVNTKIRLLTTHSIRLLCHPHPSPYF